MGCQMMLKSQTITHLCTHTQDRRGSKPSNSTDAIYQRMFLYLLHVYRMHLPASLIIWDGRVREVSKPLRR